MIELRWKETMSKVEHNGHRPVVKTVLQYRQQVDNTVYTKFVPNVYPPTLEWSEWQTVPTIQEIPN